MAGEQPSVTRGIAIVNPDRWDADNTFVAAMLAGLRSNPLLHPTTVAGLLDAVPRPRSTARPPAHRCTASWRAYNPPATAVSRRSTNTATDDPRPGRAERLVGATEPRSRAR